MRSSARQVGVARRATAALVAVVLVVVGGCAEDPAPPPEAPELVDVTPPPPVGAKVGVVLPTAGTLHPLVLDHVRADLAALARRVTGDVREVRGLLPDAPAFVADLGVFLAEEGADLVCVLTPDGVAVVRAQQRLVPDRRYCALGGTSTADPPEGIDLVLPRLDELGHLVGAGLAAAVRPGGAVALAIAPTELEAGRFSEGLRAALAHTDTLEVDRSLPPEEVVAAVVAAGAEALVVGSGPRAPDLVAAAVAAGIRVVGPEAVVASLQPEEIVVSWRVRWDVVLRGPVDRLLGRELPAPLSPGVNEDAFWVSLGRGLSARVVTEIERVERSLERGELDPLAPPPGGPILPAMMPRPALAG